MENKKIDRAFEEKHLPLIYSTAMERLGSAPLADSVCKRVFARVQEAMDGNEMPSESTLDAWLVFITQYEAGRIAGQSPSAEPEAVQPEAAAAQPQAPKAVVRTAEVNFHSRKHPFRLVMAILFSLLILVNLWFITGLLCARGILPKVDLGYSWFDTFISPLFKL